MNLTKGDYSHFVKVLTKKANTLLERNLLGQYPITIAYVDHFADRLLDRQATIDDLRSISDIVAHVLNQEICMLLYGISLDEAFRINFSRGSVVLCLTINPAKTVLTFRTVVFDRVFDGKQKVFIIKV